LGLTSPIRAALFGTALVLIAGLTFVSLRPVGPHGATQGSIAHHLEHGVAFAVLALVLLPLGRSRSQKWMLALAIFFLAGALEMRQHQLFRQPFEWWDVRDDSIGILSACLVVGRKQCTTPH
jgi:hypothetical protein